MSNIITELSQCINLDCPFYGRMSFLAVWREAEHPIQQTLQNKADADILIIGECTLKNLADKRLRDEDCNVENFVTRLPSCQEVMSRRKHINICFIPFE